jgi:hypothetical protein
MSRLALCLAAALSIPGDHLFAVSVVVPNNRETSDGYTGSFILSSPTGSARYQQLFLSTQFAALPPDGGYITRIAFRNDKLDRKKGFTQQHPSFQVDLSTTPKGPNDLSFVFSENTGADNAVVFGPGPLTFSSPVSQQTPEPFDCVIPLATPYFYDPGKGNLLMDIRATIDTSVVSILDFDESLYPLTTWCNYAYDVSADTGGGGPGIGLVTQITFAPEPSALALLASPLLALSLIRRHAKSRL